jgi:The GLUG motif
MISNLVHALLSAGLTFFASAQAAGAQTLLIATSPTNNVTCSGSVCTPTGPNAVLNAQALRKLLAKSDVTVATGTSSAAVDIRVAAAPTWVSAHTLTLDADHTIEIDKPLLAAGSGVLALVTNDGGTGGTLSFGAKGNVTFWNLASKLTINGVAYKLVGDIATLATEIAAHPSGNYALANDFTSTTNYAATPIPTLFKGTFEGLGHTIANLSVNTTTDGETGLFAVLGKRGTLRDIGLVNAAIYSENSSFSIAGALVGLNEGMILQSWATGLVRSDFWVDAGGLVGESDGLIAQSYADVNVSGANDSELGGLVGNAHGHVENCYATGPVAGGDSASIGGLVGYNLAAIVASYATGTVSGGQGSWVGGFAGQDSRRTKDSYWNVTTSGTTNGVDNTNQPGIVGLTTTQFQAGLPHGFDPAIWREDTKINGGLPYLVARPPS